MAVPLKFYFRLMVAPTEYGFEVSRTYFADRGVGVSAGTSRQAREGPEEAATAAAFR